MVVPRHLHPRRRAGLPQIIAGPGGHDVVDAENGRDAPARRQHGLRQLRAQAAQILARRQRVQAGQTRVGRPAMIQQTLPVPLRPLPEIGHIQPQQRDTAVAAPEQVLGHLVGAAPVVVEHPVNIGRSLREIRQPVINVNPAHVRETRGQFPAGVQRLPVQHRHALDREDRLAPVKFQAGVGILREEKQVQPARRRALGDPAVNRGLHQVAFEGTQAARVINGRQRLRGGGRRQAEKRAFLRAPDADAAPD